jgi:integrase
MALTDLAAKKAKPKDKDYKLSAEKGLYLLIKRSGSKYWRMKYRFANKEKTLSFGVYPEVGIPEALEKRDTARKTIREGVDPSIEKKKDKLRRQVDAENSFEAVGREWIALKAKIWAPLHTKRVTRSLELDIFPFIGNMPISDVDSVLLRTVIDPIQKRGALDIAARVRQRCSNIFLYGMAIGACTADQAEPLKVLMQPPKKKHFAALDVQEMPAFLNAVDEYNCQLQTRLAMKLMMLTFVRTSELTGASWEEIDFKKNMWVISAERMKEKRAHFIPLSKQSRECLEQIRSINGNYPLLFPKRGTTNEPMSNSTILRVIERVGYKGRMTGHGFRTLASTVLNESGEFDFDVIERQLSHQDRDDVRAAYNRAKYMGERKRMMQWWSDYFDGLIFEGNKMRPKE